MKQPLRLRTFQIGAAPRRGEGLRIGTTRRPPRGVPRDRWQRDGYFDVWFPVVAPSAALLERTRRKDFENPAVRRRFFEAYRRELQATIRGQTPWNPSACDCMTRSNTLLFRSTDPGKYATMFYGVLNARSHYFSYANAGHNPPILSSSVNSTVRLTTGGTVLGMFEGSTYEEDVVQLSSGDVLVLFSDGITEALNTEDEEFGDERLAVLVAEHRTSGAGAIADVIMSAVTLHAREMPQGDDMTVVVVKRCLS